MRAVASAFLRQRGASSRDLGLPELVALGHLLCGLPAAELRGLDSRELRWACARRGRGPSTGQGCCAPVRDRLAPSAPRSKAAPFLGSLSLRCTEQQAEVLAAHLTSSAAFGPATTWGPEIFTEVGTLAGEGWDSAMPHGRCCLLRWSLCLGTAPSPPALCPSWAP